MKNISIALTLVILLISAAILASTPRNIVAQTETVDDTDRRTNSGKSNQNPDKASNICCYC